MVVSKRERYIAIAAGIVIGVLALDALVYTPLSERTQALDEQLDEKNAALGEAALLFDRSKKMNREWSTLAGRAVTHTASDAESQVLNRVRQWAQEAGLTLAQLKPDRTEQLKDFHVTSFRASATGGMSQIGRFLYSIETATIPIRVTDVTVSTRKEGTDELSVTLTVTTIFLPSSTASATGAEQQEGQS